jgi:hypothetical protein
MKRALQFILAISLFGVVFSGVLSFEEVFLSSTTAACPSPGAPGTLFGYPACVYGFFMYALIASLSFWGLLSGRREGDSTTISS